MEAWKLTFISRATTAANTAGHLFPEAAACEAALESRFGTSLLAIKDNNLFGMKQHSHAIYGTHVLPTKEFENGEWIITDANWIKYPGWRECFQDRMATLLRLAAQFPHYAAALAATDPETFIREVSKTWATDPERGNKVLAVLSNYRDEAPVADVLGGVF